MPQYLAGVSHIQVRVNGTLLPDRAKNQVIEVIVDQHAHLPDMFTIRLHDEMDPGKKKMTIIDGSYFKLGDAVEISSPKISERNVPGSDIVLIKGEVTALEPSFEAGNIADFVVQGYDMSHRGFRSEKRIAFTDMQDSGAATKLIDFGVSGDVESTTETFKHLAVDNQTSLEYVMERAWRLGKSTHVDDMGSRLEVKDPKIPSGGADVTLEWGARLVSFRPRVSVAEQVTEVTVRGWDPIAQRPIVGKSKSSDVIAMGNQFGKGSASASKFGESKLTIVDVPVNSAAEANQLAAARMKERSLSFIEAEGEANETPEIRAGQIVQLDNLGDKFSGKYLVTSASHRWSIGGNFKTTFSVTGTRTGTAIERLTHEPPLKRWNGVYPAKVSNTTDPDKLGRAKVVFPWFDDDYQSGWARIVIVGGGQQGGFLHLPEIDDEVLVAFEHGDFDRPYILGGLYNGKFKPPTDIPGATKRSNGRVWYSKNGHRIAIYDAGDSGIDRIEVKTAGGRSMVLNDKDQNFELKTTKGITFKVDDKSGDIKIDGGNNIDIAAKMNINLKAQGNIKIEAMGNMDLKATGNATLKATGMLTTEATGNATHQATGMMTVKSSAILTVQGSLVKIN